MQQILLSFCGSVLIKKLSIGLAYPVNTFCLLKRDCYLESVFVFFTFSPQSGHWTSKEKKEEGKGGRSLHL